jgi:hypothetical protein
MTARHPWCKAGVELLTALMLFLPTSAGAQLFRAYLSGTGNDANPCTLQLPCRLLPAAVAAVASGGEIWILDSANYNTSQVNISKSLTLLAVPGALGSLVAPGFLGISIQGAATRVTLRNLVVIPFPAGGGSIGVRMESAGGSLTIEDSLVSGMTVAGIAIAVAADLIVTNSTVSANQSGISAGVGSRVSVTSSSFFGNNIGIFQSANAGGGTATLDVTSSVLAGNLHGISVQSTSATGHVRVSVRDSMIANSTAGGQGIAVNSTAGGTVVAAVTGSSITGQGGGLFATGTGKIVATDNLIVNNNIGFSPLGGGVIQTTDDNVVRNNQTNVSGSPTPLTKQ